jgi:hypothetical protein
VDDILLAYAEYQREVDERNHWCRVCWLPIEECSGGHVGWMEHFGPPPTEAQRHAYRRDQRLRKEGLARKLAALEAAARRLGYEGIEDLVEQVGPHD